jgi:hypothetical protein
VHKRRHPCKILIADLVTCPSQPIHDLGDPQRVLYEHRIRQQAEATCLIHDLLGISGSELAAVGKEQPPTDELIR